jgi:hypothetical protein
MKTKFAWYLETKPENAEEAWKNGILTVDANVLLDLYRYHTATCESIITALEAFKDRVWISYQAAHEFFRNRKRVIASSEKTFSDAVSGLAELDGSIDGAISKLRAYRLVRPHVDGLSESLKSAIEKARDQMDEARNKYPNYLKDDPILGRILELFNGRVGARPAPEALSRALVTAEQRHKQQVPPGYLDEEKEGDRKYGDFLLWSQIMDFAKEAGRPVILVTSERKEDWWERSSGKTLGPRLELLEEFHETTGQQIFLYQTENFLKLSAEHAGTPVTQDAVQEIRELGDLRSRPRPQHLPAVSVEQHPHVYDDNEQIGMLEIQLLREVHNLTGSGRLRPPMQRVPDLEASLLAAPNGCPAVKVTAGSSTAYNFHVHIHSAERDALLPVGTYILEYVATVAGQDSLPFADPVENDTGEIPVTESA